MRQGGCAIYIMDNLVRKYCLPKTRAIHSERFSDITYMYMVCPSINRIGEYHCEDIISSPLKCDQTQTNTIKNIRLYTKYMGMYTWVSHLQ